MVADADHGVAREIEAGTRGALERVRARHGRDFGRVLERPPRVVVRAECEEDVAHTLRTATRHELEVAIQGAHHSCAGQTLAADGILLRNLGRADPPRLMDDQRVELCARSTWRDVERHLNPRGRTIPVLADFLDLSVGGTLSVGGYGVDSIAHGAQVDHVERLRVVCPDGQAVWCSPSEVPDLFRFTLAGLGQLGAIERVVMRTATHRPVTTLFIHRHQSLVELVHSLEWLTAEPPPPVRLFKALAVGNRFESVYGVGCRSLREALLIGSPGPPHRPSRRLVCPRYRWWRSLAVRLWVARFPRCRRLWSDYLVDYPGLCALVRTIDELKADEAFRSCLRATYIVAVRRPERSFELPLEALGAGPPMMKFGIGLYTMVPDRDAAALDATRRALRVCLELAVDLGGRPYLYGHHDLDSALIRRIYGSALDRLNELRSAFDPAGVLAGRRLGALARAQETAT